MKYRPAVAPTGILKVCGGMVIDAPAPNAVASVLDANKSVAASVVSPDR